MVLLAFVFALWNRPTALSIVVFALVLLAALAVLALLAAGGRAEGRHLAGAGADAGAGQADAGAGQGAGG
jgi:hypothetical protein